MRTTIILPDDLLNAAKQAASARGTTLTAVIADALRAALAEPESGHTATSFQVPTFNGDGLRPGVDLDDTAALIDLMDDGNA
jgi:hypothetical protein